MLSRRRKGEKASKLVLTKRVEDLNLSKEGELKQTVRVEMAIAFPLPSSLVLSCNSLITTSRRVFYTAAKHHMRSSSP